MTMDEAVLKHHPQLTLESLGDQKKLMSYLKEQGIAVEAKSAAELKLQLFEETVEELLIQPIFITDYPAISSPLARRSDGNADLTDRFELFIAGQEVANGFSELNDPEDQASRFKHQMEQKIKGDHEAMPYDEDYIRFSQT